MTNDVQYMQQAINQAQMAGPETWLNPRVGAVIVKNQQVLSVGYTHRFGSIHAERDAISKLSPDQLFHSTLYVTLEPCNHYGKQPPCSQLIVDSQISRVVIAQIDPNPLVAGKGIATLQNAGISVTNGVLSKEAEQINPHYNFFFAHQRPWITVKQAVSLDYKVSSRPGKRTNITNQAVYDYVHRERANYNGIVIGSQTAIVDNPHLLTSVKSPYPPIRIVIDRRGRLAFHQNLNLLTDRKAPTWIFSENSELAKQLTNSAAKVIVLKDASITKVIDKISHLGLQGIYVEGGPTIQAALMETGLVDEVLSYISPRLLGSTGLTGFQVRQPISFKHTSLSILDNNIRIAERNDY